MKRLQLLAFALTFTAATVVAQNNSQSMPSSSAGAQTPAAGSAQQPAAGSQAGQAQQPAAQTGNGTTGTVPQTAASAAPSSQNNISGCLTRGFAYDQISDASTGKTYQIRGNLTNLSQHENHVVQI